MEDEFIYNQSIITIFNTNILNNKRLLGFQGYGCDVKLSLGGIKIACMDHKIACTLVHSHIHNIELILEPHINVKDQNQDQYQYQVQVQDWNVKLFWSNVNGISSQFIIDETLDEILITVKYICGAIGVNFESYKEKNYIMKIIKELSNKHFLQDSTQEQKVIEILESYYSNIKVI